MSDLRCWQCGVEPIETADVRTFGDPAPVLVVVRWPDGDHEHGAERPTPDELVARGHHALERVRSLM